MHSLTLSTENACHELLDWSSLVVGKTSPWLVLDSPSEVERKNSEQVRHRKYKPMSFQLLLSYYSRVV